MSIRTRPHSTVSAETLADWIESETDRWWSVDGDPWLMGEVDFPCPSDELAPAIRRIGNGKDILVSSVSDSFPASPKRIGADQLAELFNGSRYRDNSELLCAWGDSEEEWLLLEDVGLLGD